VPDGATSPDEERVSERLRTFDLQRLTGQTDLLRSVARFNRQISGVTLMLEEQRRRAQLLRGVMGLDATRRDVLGTAIGAAAVTKGLQLGLERHRFIEHSTVSLGTLASAQLSTPAIQALTRPAFRLPGTALDDRMRLAAYTGLSEHFHRAIAGPRTLTSGLMSPIQGFSATIRRFLEGFAGSTWKLVQLRQEIDDDALVFVERHGWPLPLALPIRVVHHVVGMAARGRREVQRFMTDSFGPRTRAYRASRDRLLTSNHFASRRQPIEQGLNALNRGHYYAAICTLLPLVEGVLVDVVLAADPPEKGAAHRAFDEMRDIGDEVDAIVVRSVETLVVSAASGAALFSRFERRDYGSSGESRRLNRHAILHGSARRYGTHANALRLFLLLVALAEALDIYRDEQGDPPSAAPPMP